MTAIRTGKLARTRAGAIVEVLGIEAGRARVIGMGHVHADIMPIRVEDLTPVAVSPTGTILEEEEDAE